jgi:hypothetical protein
VFPRLKRYCQRRGWSFQAIDLRWGISNEAALDQSTMRICRAEIARCQAVTPRPNCVVLLGDRHGWRPLPALAVHLAATGTHDESAAFKREDDELTARVAPKQERQT